MIRDSRALSLFGVIVILFCFSSASANPEKITAASLVNGALNMMRGKSSYTEMTMKIKRPTWERSSSIVGWSRGQEDSLIRFTAPARDSGNALLKLDDKMWTYTPKLNRSIRLPYSLMSQSWAGSDFSYNDLARTDNLLKYYDLTIIETVKKETHTIYKVEAVPHDDAPVVWGRETWTMRDDYVILEEVFYDQALVPLKRLVTLEIGIMGGRPMATRMRMEMIEEPNHWTEIVVHNAEFDLDLDSSMFTVFALKSAGN